MGDRTGAYGGRRRLVNRRQVNLLCAALAGLAAVAAAPAPARAAEPPRLLALGDSLTAGYGLPADQSFTAQLQAWLKHAGVDVTVEDAGVSGDTSAGGLTRLDWALGSAPPQFALVELGANDALRGLSTQALYANLDKILTQLQARGVKVLLVGMYAPPNLGRDYDTAFDAVYPRLAQQHGVPLYPFFLAGVVGDAKLLQPDGLHPNAKGVAVIVDRIGPVVARLVNASQAAR